MEDITSIKKLGEYFGVTHRSASKWLKHRTFPVQREAPWSSDDIAEIREWRKTLRPNRASPQYQGRTAEPPADEQSKDYWLMRKYRSQALAAESELLDAETVREAWVSTLAEIRQRLLMVPAAVCGRCVERDVAEIERIIEAAIRSALDGAADRVGDVSAVAGHLQGWRESAGDTPAAEAE